jgi:hypothetical protein
MESGFDSARTQGAYYLLPVWQYDYVLLNYTALDAHLVEGLGPYIYD